MTKQLTEQAQVAKLIRAELKSNNINASVKSSSASMTTKVTVTLTNCEPWVIDAVERGIQKYQYGHFDGMNDCYEYSNNRSDIPQVRFISVNVRYSDELKQKALDLIADHYNLEKMTLDNKPATLDIDSFSGRVCYTESLISNVLSNTDHNFFNCPKFWIKPVRKIMSVSA